MSKLSVPSLPIISDNSVSTLTQVVTRLYELLRESAIQVNNMSEGAIVGRYAARTSVPTTGTFKQGDIVWNAAPAELGSVGARYTLLGWVCIASGSPGSWREMRATTGT